MRDRRRTLHVRSAVAEGDDDPVDIAQHDVFVLERDREQLAIPKVVQGCGTHPPGCPVSHGGPR